MKVLVCASEYYPHGSGIANVAYNVVEKLKKKGIECVVCSPTGPDIKIGNIGKYGRLSLIYFWYKVNNYFKDINNDYDIVWLHNPLFITNNPFKKCLVTIHSMPHGKVSKRLYPWHLHFYYLIASKIDAYCLNKLENVTFTVVDPTISKELIDTGINEKDIVNIPNGVNSNLFKPNNNKKYLREKLKLPDEDIIILSFGRLTEHKQPLELIEIFAIINNYMNNITLVVCGDGDLLKNVKNRVKEKSLDNVKILGHINHKEAPSIYACSDYYIIPSKYEGQPLTLLEAMASGLKCIVSDIPTLKSIVEYADCGINIDVSDKVKASKDIIEYIKSNNSIHSFNAREYAVYNYDWEMISDKYLNEFKRIVSIMRFKNEDFKC